ncbi:hypothetical protein [Halosimplex pelagicum]|uniref:Uncharacterized protein n=1 Tax=Halosimplex pelagicum TaxID=869886 RepID=A0A7D5T294_9EURY|nr:hypothetical protein [Halosimplex pelagicum]QLH80991.1 hypothetical protein HZS54_04780 [Halosimplex pelagicum]
MPGLRDKAILEIDLRDESGNVRTGKFFLQEDLNDSSELSKLFLLSNRGQYISEAFDVASDQIPDDILEGETENRRGYHVDGGAGTFGYNLTANVGPEEDPWGDGSAAAGAVNRYDASGDVALVAKKQVLEWYVGQAKTDSGNPARLHVGEWTDGSHGTDVGAYEHPLTVAITELNIDNDPDKPSAFNATITVEWTTPWAGAVDWAQDVVDDIAEIIPEF